MKKVNKKLITAPKRNVAPCVRTRAQFVMAVRTYLRKTGMSLTELGNRALGSHSVLSRYMSQPRYRISFENAQAVLKFMERTAK